jgi:cell division protein FtsI/penicillin-binding protein 2
LRGTAGFGDALLHRPQIGADITTTLDVRWQTDLAAQLGAQTGGAVALNWRTGETLAMVSAPFYNPNTLDKDWDALKQSPSAPLLNRAVDGAYPADELGVGATASPMQAAAALIKQNRAAALPIRKTVARPSGGSVTWLAELRGDVLVVVATENLPPTK